MGAAILGDEQGGSGCPDPREDLRGGDSCRHALQVGDMGHDNVHWESFGSIPPQGGPHSDG